MTGNEGTKMCNFICVAVLVMLTGLCSFFAIDALLSCNIETTAIYTGNTTRVLSYQANGRNVTFINVEIPWIKSSETQYIPICYHLVNYKSYEIGGGSYISLPGTIALFFVAGALLIITLFVFCVCCVRRSNPVSTEYLPQSVAPEHEEAVQVQDLAHVINIPLSTLTTDKKDCILFGKDEKTNNLYIVENPH